MRKTELAEKVGPDHPEMGALNVQLKFLKALMEQQGSGLSGSDELARHHFKLEAERDALTDQIKELELTVAADEDKASKMFTASDKIDRLKQSIDRRDDKVKDLQMERNQIQATTTGGGYRVQAITPPDEGVKIAPVLSKFLLLGGFLGLMVGFGLSLLADYSDRSFRSPSEISKRLGFRVLGHIPWLRSGTPAKKVSKSGLDTSLAAFFGRTRPNPKRIAACEHNCTSALRGAITR